MGKKKFMKAIGIALLMSGLSNVITATTVNATDARDFAKKFAENYYIRYVVLPEDYKKTLKEIKGRSSYSDYIIYRTRKEVTGDVYGFLSDFRSVMSYWIEKGDLEKIKELVEKFDVIIFANGLYYGSEDARNLPCFIGSRILDAVQVHETTQGKHFQIVQYLRQRSSIVESQFGKYYPPDDTNALYLMLKNNHLTLGLTQYFISRGANRGILYNTETIKRGWGVEDFIAPAGNALHVAAKNGDTMVLSCLVEDIIDNYGQIINRSRSKRLKRRISSMTGVESGDLARKLEVREFLDYLINIDEHNGKTALYLATHRYCSLNDSSILRCFEDYLKFVDATLPQIGLNKTMIIATNKANFLVLEYCLSNGACIESQFRGLSAMMIASKKRHLPIVDFLFKYGADINARSNDGRTPLMFASQYGHSDIVKYLLEHGSDINARSNDGRTPLMFASQYGHSDIVKYLLEHGADINARSDNGKDALQLAIDNNAFPVAECIEEHMIELDASSNGKKYMPEISKISDWDEVDKSIIEENTFVIFDIDGVLLWEEKTMPEKIEGRRYTDIGKINALLDVIGEKKAIPLIITASPTFQNIFGEPKNVTDRLKKELPEIAERIKGFWESDTNIWLIGPAGNNPCFKDGAIFTDGDIAKGNYLNQLLSIKRNPTTNKLPYSKVVFFDDTVLCLSNVRNATLMNRLPFTGYWCCFSPSQEKLEEESEEMPEELYIIRQPSGRSAHS